MPSAPVVRALALPVRCITACGFGAYLNLPIDWERLGVVSALRMTDMRFVPALAETTDHICRMLHGPLLGDPSNGKVVGPNGATTLVDFFAGQECPLGSRDLGSAISWLGDTLSQPQTRPRDPRPLPRMMQAFASALAGTLESHPTGASLDVVKSAVDRLAVEQLRLALEASVAVGAGPSELADAHNDVFRLFEALTHWRKFVPADLSDGVKETVQKSVQVGFDRLLQDLKLYPTDIMRAYAAHRFVEKGRLWAVFPELPVALDESLPSFDPKGWCATDVRALGWEQVLLDCAYALRRNPTPEGVRSAATRYNQAVDEAGTHEGISFERIASAVHCLYAAFWQTACELEVRSLQRIARNGGSEPDQRKVESEIEVLSALRAVALAGASLSPLPPYGLCSATPPDDGAIRRLEFLVIRRGLKAALS
jgi:hypothetical protein